MSVVPHRWVGIDEAGYGPNLGPFVMTAVVAESPDARPPDVWADRSDRVCRAGGPRDRLWVDDSKRLHGPGRAGLDRLEAATLAVVLASGADPGPDLTALLAAVGAGDLVEVELAPWLEGASPPVPLPASRPRVEPIVATRPLDGLGWRIVGVRSVVMGPARFNAELTAAGSKTGPHRAAFLSLLRAVRGEAPGPLAVCSDKHGGRHFYLELLSEAFPAAWIHRGPEGPELSRYTVRHGDHATDLAFRPRADAADGLVALASIVSKTLRERWMAGFNAFWQARLPDLKPTAGYPTDAARFRRAIEPLAAALGRPESSWWRAR